jgi:glycosyltransferase involved in cell wall biosynthesis
MKEEREYSISLCTVCRNRLEHLKKTLPENILSNAGEDRLEFVVLDYNSNDGLQGWIHTEMGHWIQSGVLNYYRTNDPPYFTRSHSRNMAMRLARGKVICNLDADNYADRGFVEFLVGEFNLNEDIFYCAGNVFGKATDPNILGRIAMTRNDFNILEGFDEEMEGYGFEDQDLLNRLQAAGLTKKIYPNPSLLRSLSHNLKARIGEEKLYNTIQSVWVSYLNPAESEMLFLFAGGEFFRFTIVSNRALHAAKKEFAFVENLSHFEYSIKDNRITNGRFVEQPGETFYRITDPDLIMEAIFFFSQLRNRIKMAENDAKELIAVNKGRFGNGMVFKNFDLKNPIQL